MLTLLLQIPNFLEVNNILLLIRLGSVKNSQEAKESALIQKATTIKNIWAEITFFAVKKETVVFNHTYSVKSMPK